MTNKILEKAIDDFDVIEFLHEYEIDYKTSGDNIGTGWIGVAPCPNELCGDSEYHFGINEKTKTFNCWKCKYTGNLINFIADILNTSNKEAIRFILKNSNEYEEDLDILSKVKNILKESEKEEKEEEIKKFEKIKTIPINRDLVNHVNFIEKFLIEKRMTISDALNYKFQIAVSGKYKGKLVIPITYRRIIVGYLIRNFFKSQYIKIGKINNYLYMDSKIIPNKPLIIVEGVFDYINTYNFIERYFPNKFCITACFSKIITDSQIEKISNKNPKNVIFMLDGDSWQDYYKTKQRLDCDSNFVILQKDKDPGDLTDKEFIKVFHEAVCQ